MTSATRRITSLPLQFFWWCCSRRQDSVRCARGTWSCSRPRRRRSLGRLARISSIIGMLPVINSSGRIVIWLLRWVTTQKAQWRKWRRAYESSAEQNGMLQEKNKDAPKPPKWRPPKKLTEGASSSRKWMLDDRWNRCSIAASADTWSVCYFVLGICFPLVVILLRSRLLLVGLVYTC